MEKKEKKGSIFDSTIEAFQSFLRVPNTVTKRGSHADPHFPRRYL